ncbi:MAG: glycosyltransferase [Beijerinckiaceae bacterium]|nr:glycosyltransferase [Beijerinckiaceae bacterium]
MTSLPFRNRGLHPLNKVSVLQIIPGPEVTPSAQAALDVAASLSAAGARALVACTDRLKGELQVKGGIFLPFSLRSNNPLTMALSVRRLARLIEDERADIVHVRSRAIGWTAYGATRLTKTPLVTSFGAGYDASNPVALRYNSVLARGDLVLAESSFAASLAVKHHSPAAERIRIIHQGLDCRVFSPAAVEPERVEKMRRQWMVAPHEQIVLMPAPYGHGSGHKILIEAAGLLLRSGLAGVKFILASNNEEAAPLCREIDRAIAREGLQGVMYGARLCDLPAALLAASIVVAPATRTRGLGDAAIQAQAMGTPVIAANLGAAQEHILAPPSVPESVRTGFLVPPSDPPALAVAIANVLTLGATAGSKLSSRAIKHAERSFSAELMCAATLQAYIDVRRGGEA